eukprot:TRINITY_DN57245_c0_g1_i1.p1 TRINITY_DN57245_c0_g1~~TRINITY_DN57245_c0_g1_i1.p1  ORF type:complete len:1089 (+),score=185.15 TRINITY_DN57245_c0_g1_i1:49-3315(+)
MRPATSPREVDWRWDCINCETALGCSASNPLGTNGDNLARASGPRPTQAPALSGPRKASRAGKDDCVLANPQGPAPTKWGSPEKQRRPEAAFSAALPPPPTTDSDGIPWWLPPPVEDPMADSDEADDCDLDRLLGNRSLAGTVGDASRAGYVMSESCSDVSAQSPPSTGQPETVGCSELDKGAGKLFDAPSRNQDEAADSHLLGQVHLEDTSRVYLQDIQEEPEPEADDGNVEEQEEQPNVDVRKELYRALLVAFCVVAMFGLLFGSMAYFKAQFEPPHCDVSARVSLKPCEPCAKRKVFLPLFGEYEQSFSRVLRGFVYFFGLVWVFLGVGVICDKFMDAIEEITGAERIVWVKVRQGTELKFRTKVWNCSVANLTLTALGTSAPEIVLNVIEVVSNRQFTGNLGPSTIIGSAAFNLLVIMAVCVAALPANEVRSVLFVDVFAVTSSTSVLAYLWLVLILQVISPDRVEVWEAVLTLAFFPLFVLAAFAADKGWLRKSVKNASPLNDISKSTLGRKTVEFLHDLRIEATTSALNSPLKVAAKSYVSAARAQRSSFVRQVTGGMKGQSSRARDAAQNGEGAAEVSFGFKKADMTVMENCRSVSIDVVASREPLATVSIKFMTREGTASGTRYVHTEGELVFGPHQTEKCIEVKIIDNDHWDANECFFLELSSPEVIERPHFGLGSTTEVSLSRPLICIDILNDDPAPTICFEADEVYTEEGATVQVGVFRRNSVAEKVKCEYGVETGSATAGLQFADVSGSLTFDSGETYKTVDVNILRTNGNDPAYREKRFKVVLHSVSYGAAFLSNSGSDESKVSCEVVIRSGTKMPSYLQTMTRKEFHDRVSLWADEFRCALYCGGSPEDQADAAGVDWFFHFLSVFWKFLFSVVPPPGVFGGWVSFVVSLGMILFMTAIVGDLAALVGCCIGIPDEVTAITLVALGTSLPDTFASKAAAQQDETADNSVGAVCGSNSVNVFLGLGLPWTFCSIYWQFAGPTSEWMAHLYKGKTFGELYLPRYPSGGFVVPAESLYLNVSAFTLLAILALSLLVCRRHFYGGELGGPRVAQRRDSAILFSFWVSYVGFSIWITSI